MSEHAGEYQELLARTAQADRGSIEAHWDLGELFGRYGEPVADIALAIGRSVTYVAEHVRLVQVIATREILARVLAERDDVTSWTVLIDWVKAGGPGQASDAEPDAADISRQRRRPQAQGSGQQGGLQLTVPAHVIKGLADLGLNPRECMGLFWQNATPNLIMSVAYPGTHRHQAAS